MSGNPLGLDQRIPIAYAPEVLFAIERSRAREQLGIADQLPFVGVDIWNCYELSWLQPDGRPVSCSGEIRYHCNSPNIVESKSLKLYLYSLNMTTFSSVSEVEALIARDLSQVLQTDLVEVSIHEDPIAVSSAENSECIDSSTFPGLAGDIDTSLLQAARDAEVAETLVSRIFRSLCPVTAQPDWATVTIAYRGPKIEKGGLLGYLASYRNHQGFHEECCERIFIDVSRACLPSELTVICGFTRRGGIDINPIRSTRALIDTDYRRNSRQ